MGYSGFSTVRAAMLASASIATALTFTASAPAKAQALQPVVDVCTGIQVNDSVLRNILSRTVVPTATGVENLFDNLLNVSILGLPLLSIPDVNLGVAATTADIAAGNTVSLQVLDKSGNLVAPGNCNLTADGIALNTPAGIAIGGNQISGLGSGTAASAGALDAIAFGNGASTGIGSTGAVALGTNASVAAANGVSLGAGSTNTRGALAGYTAFGITGPSNSAGTVSFGSAGAERQLTNIAPGTAATDAATLGQVQGAILTARDGVVLYDNAGGTSVTFAGVGGTRLTNVAAATLGAGSTDAVNGGQLFATNQQVGTNTTNITANTGAITTLQGQVTTNTGNIGTLQGQVGTNTTNIAANTGAIATAQAGVTANTAGLAALDSAAVKYDDASHGTVTFDGAVPTRLTNVAQGAVAATSSDAVTGAQLFATNQAIAVATGSLGLALTYDDASLASATLGGAAGTTITNLAAGTVAAGSTSAVNGSQLFATNQQVGANTTAITGIDGRVTQNTTNITTNTGAITTLQGQVGTNTTNITSNTGAITTLQGQVTTNTGAITNVQNQVATNTTAITNVQAGLTVNTAGLAALDASAVKYDDASHGTVTFDGAGGTRLTNVAQGAVAATSSDAVTGAQLFATNQAIAAATGAPGLALTYDDATLASATLGGAAGTTITNLAAGTVAAGSTSAVNGSQLFATNQQVGANTTAITNIDGRVTQNTTNITSIDGRVTQNTSNIANLDGRVTQNTSNITNIDGRVTQNTGDIINLTTQTNNNAGTIVAIDARVTNNTTQLTSIQNQVNNVPVGYVSDANGTTPSATPTNTAAFEGAAGGPVRVTNVAAGTLAAGSSDAVNGSQLAATNTAVDRNRADIVSISATIGAGFAAPLQYSNGTSPTTPNGGVPTQDVTLVGADPAQPVRVHNVADGVTANDAVNVRQLQASVAGLQSGIANSLDQSRAYTDQQIAQVGFDLRELRKNSFSGTAAAMAMAAIPQTITNGESMFGGAVGHYRGQTAFGFGYSTTASDRVVVKATGTIDTHGKGGIAAGAGFSF
ncbi:autotransporter adhesin [Novosphingobium hassiacum]|uniref:Autotransporter adhesin n=1 Tax=Novosphingobium hassiacum TaxID=173676 RepID=A0A7W5ZYX8_9SPHN|nr:YadA-like family protein [Novosphingobium hassiacum]MBB3861658.1 autotransporter adhesin [Novosphingobium hassiacum]